MPTDKALQARDAQVGLAVLYVGDPAASERLYPGQPGIIAGVQESHVQGRPVKRCIQVIWAGRERHSQELEFLENDQGSIPALTPATDEEFCAAYRALVLAAVPGFNILPYDPDSWTDADRREMYY